MAVAGCGLLCAPALATDRTWTNAAGGDFAVPANWYLGTPPSSSDRAVFDLAALYTVNFTSAATTSDLLLRGGTVTLHTGSYVYQVNTQTTIAEVPGQVATLALDGAWLTGTGSSFISIGQTAGSTGELAVGAASSWKNLGMMVVADQGTGYLTLSGGGVVSCGMGVIGKNYYSGSPVVPSNGIATVDGVGSTWAIAGGGLSVGAGGAGLLAISNGGAVTNSGTAYVGGTSSFSSPVSRGTVTVSGAGSTWSNTSTGAPMAIGYNAPGSLGISAGGLVTCAADFVLGATTTGSGTATLDGRGSRLTVATKLNVGGYGWGEMIMIGGATATSLEGWIARDYSSGATDPTGRATLDGVGTMWIVTGLLGVGGAGSGDLTISNGALLTSGADAYIGGSAYTGGPAPRGNVIVTGPGSAWASTSTSMPMYVGYSGAGSLTVNGGGSVVTGYDVIVGRNSGISGTLSVSGVGTHVDVGHMLTVGETGNGTLSILAGAAVSTPGGAFIGKAMGSRGTVVVDGLGSRWGMDMSGANPLAVGFSGTATLAVTNGGAVRVGADSSIAPISSGGGATVTVDGIGSTLAATRWYVGGDSSTTGAAVALTVSNGGTFSQSGTMPMILWSTVAANVVGGTIAVPIGGMDNRGGRITLSGMSAQITGSGTLVNTGLLTGSGRVTPTLINQGPMGEVRVGGADDLVFASTGSAANYAKINLINGGTVEFGGMLTNQSAGTISGRGTIIAGSLVNSGKMSFSGGFTDVFGPVTNTGGSKIIVTGAGTTTFYSDMLHNGGADIRVDAGCVAVYLGNVTGSGTFSGTGTNYFNDGSSFMAAISGPGTLVVAELATLTADSIHESGLEVYGSAAIRPNGTAAGTSVVKRLTMGPSAKLDVANNALVVDYSDTGISPAASIRTWLASGYAEGAWTGVGINSSVAHAHAGTALGYADNAASQAVTVAYTWAGDSDLSKSVNFDDLLALAQNYGKASGASWAMGDFTYDSKVNFDDLLSLAQHYGAGAGGLSGTELAQLDAAHPNFGTDAQTAFAMAAVPEPASLGLLAVAATGLLARRRRRD